MMGRRENADLQQCHGTSPVLVLKSSLYCFYNPKVESFPVPSKHSDTHALFLKSPNLWPAATTESETKTPCPSPPGPQASGLSHGVGGLDGGTDIASFPRTRAQRTAPGPSPIPGILLRGDKAEAWTFQGTDRKTHTFTLAHTIAGPSLGPSNLQSPKMKPVIFSPSSFEANSHFCIFTLGK